MKKRNITTVTVHRVSKHCFTTPAIRDFVFEGTRNVNNTHLGMLRNLAEQGHITLQ